jgi:CDP-4-dehydro-6-deoxyglucose reductase
MTQEVIQVTSIEGLGENIEQKMCGDVRTKSFQAIQNIFAGLKLGMSEAEAIRMANSLLASMGVKRFWHRTHVRFGASTALSFDDPYIEGVRLNKNDMVSIDIGPVWDGIEGDAGSSFVFGVDDKKQKLIDATKNVFDELVLQWRHQGLSGKKLMTLADELAKEKGYLLAPAYVKGHRLAEFPHAFYSKHSLYDLDKCPQAKRWVLEVQLCEPQMSYGAFYEDILQ